MRNVKCWYIIKTMQTLLPILLIILTLVILVKHYDSNMKTGEVLILIMIFILVAYTCYSYMKLEGFADYKASIMKNNFVGNNKKVKKPRKLGDEDSDEDDSDEGETTDKFDNVQSVKADAIFAEEAMPSSDFQKMIGSKSKFADIPSTTVNNSTDGLEAADGLKSIFNPSIIISGKNGRVNALGANLYDGGNNQEDSDYTDYNQMMENAQSGNSNGRVGVDQQNTSSDNNSSNNGNTDFPYARGDYEYWSSMSKENAKDGKGLDGRPLLIFPKSKLYYPGFQYINPTLWDVPQRRPEMCIPSREVYPPAGVVETKFSFLEYNEMGKIADQEKQVTETNVGSIMPPFIYKSLPYATP
jgi:hypothetical protein